MKAELYPPSTRLGAPTFPRSQAFALLPPRIDLHGPQLGRARTDPGAVCLVCPLSRVPVASSAQRCRLLGAANPQCGPPSPGSAKAKRRPLVWVGRGTEEVFSHERPSKSSVLRQPPKTATDALRKHGNRRCASGKSKNRHFYTRYIFVLSVKVLTKYQLQSVTTCNTLTA